MNNKKIFSLNMFWQTFKASKMIGILATALTTAIGVLIIIADVTSEEMYIDENGMAQVSSIVQPSVVDIILEHGYVMFSAIAVGLFMTLSVWKFLNKRNTSDFYHSLAHTRICIFISKAVAVIAWLFVVVFSSYISLAIMYGINSKYYVVDYSIMFRLHMAAFVCGLLVFGAVSFACAVTGNTFNNLVVTEIILFFPRIMWSVASSGVESIAQIVSRDKAIPFLNGTQNMITGLFSMMIEGQNNIQEIVISSEANWYTGVLGIIYTVLALILFNVRKSECAGVGAYGKKTSFIIGSLISMIISATGIINMLVQLSVNKEATDIEIYAYFYSAISTCILGFIGVFVYEFFSSRKNVLLKLKETILPTISGWGVAVLLGVMVYAIAMATLSYAPDKNDIQYVRISSSEDIYWGTELSYYDDIARHTKLKDEAVFEIISDSIKTNVQKVKEGNYERFYHQNSSYVGVEKQEEGYVQYDVYIQDGIVGQYRKLYLSAAQSKKIKESIIKTEEYRKAYYDLPAYEDAVVKWYSNGKLGVEKDKKIYETFLEELKSVRFEDYYDFVTEENYDMSSVGVSISFTRNSYTYEISLRPRRSLFPKTVSAFYNCSNEKEKSDEQMVKTVIGLINRFKENKGMVDKTDESVSIAFYMPGYEDYRAGNYYVIGTQSECKGMEDETVAGTLIPTIIKELESDKTYNLSEDNILVRIHYSKDSRDSYISRTYYMTLDSDIGVNWEVINYD